MYTEYVKNFDQAMSSLSKWKTKSPKFASVIEDIQVICSSQIDQLYITSHLSILRFFKMYTVHTVIFFVFL